MFRELNLTDLPEALHNDVTKLYDSWKWLIPNWVQRVRFVFEEISPAGTLMRCVADDIYREAVITVCSSFVSANYETKEIAMVHELNHALCGPLPNKIYECLKIAGIDNPELLKLIETDITNAHEQITQDYTWALINRFKQE